MKFKLSLGRLCRSNKKQLPQAIPTIEKDNGSVDLYPPEDINQLMILAAHDNISSESVIDHVVDNVIVSEKEDFMTVQVEQIDSSPKVEVDQLIIENNDIAPVIAVADVDIEIINTTISASLPINMTSERVDAIESVPEVVVEAIAADSMQAVVSDATAIEAHESGKNIQGTIAEVAPALLQEILSSPAHTMSPAKVQSLAYLEAISPSQEMKSPTLDRKFSQSSTVSRALFSEEALPTSSVPIAPPLPEYLKSTPISQTVTQESEFGRLVAMNNLLENLEELYQNNRESFTEKHVALLNYFKSSKRDTWCLEEFQENLQAELDLLRESGIVTLMTYYFEELLKHGKSQRVAA